MLPKGTKDLSIMALVGLLEDNDRIAKLCATFLHFAGHQVIIYDNSLDCLQALFSQRRSQKNSFSTLETAGLSSLPVEVLILDLSLPDINGIEVLRYLTSHPHTQSLPLIICTAATGVDIAKARQIAPHVSIIEKPFKFQTLIAAISSALEPTTAQ
ncbi:MAG: response regulator [Chloroflexi bacterium]|nr:MAG: response regulator [Chloroflexota bacterium]TMD32914.1 MAG: response regulator [Chloroflexota bacterium]TMD74779.1 MAG: response regulator [Chloroflexota bacterium]TME60150.1 MAG: response regulator [Chloroflexota bacterium]